MKVNKQETPTGYLFTLNLSQQDLLENDLMTSFGLNSFQEYELKRTGKFSNFINNYIITYCYDKMNESVHPGAQPPLFKVIGEKDNFVQVTVFFPKNLQKEKQSPHPNGPKPEYNFDGIYTDKEATAKAEPGWNPNASDRMKLVAKN
jgi:hypothetical protein